MHPNKEISLDQIHRLDDLNHLIYCICVDGQKENLAYDPEKSVTWMV